MVTMFKILLNIFLNLLLLSPVVASEIIVELGNIDIVAGEIYFAEIHIDKDDSTIKENLFLTPFLYFISKTNEQINENNYDKKTIAGKVIFTNDYEGNNTIQSGSKVVKIIGVKSFQKTEVSNFSFYSMKSNWSWILYTALLVLLPLGYYLWRRGKKRHKRTVDFIFIDESSRDYFERMFAAKNKIVKMSLTPEMDEMLNFLSQVVYKKTWTEDEIHKLSELNRKIASGK
jgi:hypothetical protein